MSLEGEGATSKGMGEGQGGGRGFKGVGFLGLSCVVFSLVLLFCA